MTNFNLTDGAVERLAAFMERNPSICVAGG